MDNNILFIGMVVSGLGLTTIIGFIANLWLKSITHEKDIQRIEKKVEYVENKENKDFEELKKKNETFIIAIAKLENLPNDIHEIRTDIKSILSLMKT